MERHPKGLDYGHIVKKNPLYPMLFDSEGKVLSFPPIINSNDLGKITEESRNLLVEVTGTQHGTVVNTLNLVTAALIDRGGKAYSATIHYPEGNRLQAHGRGYARFQQPNPAAERGIHEQAVGAEAFS